LFLEKGFPFQSGLVIQFVVTEREDKEYRQSISISIGPKDNKK